MSVSFSGLSSGLNTDKIISQLLKIERKPQIRYKNQIKQAQKTQQAFQDLQSRVSTLLNRVSELSQESTFQQKKVTSSKTGVLTASIADQSKVQSGTFDVFVEQLATNPKVTSGQQILNQNMVANGSPSGSATLVSDFEVVEGADNLDLTGTKSTQSMLSQLSNEVETSGDPRAEFTLDLNDDGDRVDGGEQVDLDSFSNFQQVINAINTAAANEESADSDGTADGKDIDGDAAKETFKFEYNESRDKFVMTPLESDGNGGNSLDADDNDQAGFMSDASHGFLQQIGFNEDETIHSYDQQESTIAQNVASINPSKNIQDNVFTSQLTNPSSTNTVKINNTNIDIDPTTESINDFVSKINDKVSGVKATYNSATDKVSLRAENTGAGSIDVSDVSGNLADVLNLRTDGTASGSQAAGVQDNGTDAKVKIDGDTVTADGNTLTFNGIKLDLKTLHKQSNNSGDPVKVEAGKDVQGITNAVQDFVNQFNSIMEFINTRNNTNPASEPGEQRGKSGVFANDSTIRRIKNTLTETVTQRFEQATGSDLIQDAGSVGIEQKDPLTVSDKNQGKLNFNASKFKQALRDAPTAVEDLFTASTSEGDPADGLGTDLKSYIKNGLTDNLDGVLPSRIDGFDRKIENLNERIQENKEHVKQRRQQLEQKFLQMEQMLTRLNSQKSFISARL